MTETESKNAQKAMAYDLKLLLGRDPTKTYTAEEIMKLIDAYIAGTTQ